MRLARSLAVTLAILGLSLAAMSEEPAKPPPIKALMGENFGGLQVILVSLITSSYAAVPAKADVIRDHASELTGMVPEDLPQTERDRFLSLAFALQTRAESLKSISEVLIQHDQEGRASGRLETDHLREALAAHYGGMVTTCVACHNRYRQQAVARP